MVTSSRLRTVSVFVLLLAVAGLAAVQAQRDFQRDFQGSERQRSRFTRPSEQDQDVSARLKAKWAAERAAVTSTQLATRALYLPFS
jgi:hypothetical protein